LSQSISDFEYVVIDGASTDGTLEVIREMTIGINVRVTSERDAGIYDAMNKGVRIARGKWLYFLNAGDRFADDGVLERVLATFNKSPKIKLGYGDVIYCAKGQQRLVRFDWLRGWNLRFEHLCHQAVFARRDLFERLGGFDLRFRINADWDWLLRAFSCGIGRTYLGFPIALYDGTGFSEHEFNERVLEREIVRKQHMPRMLGPLLKLLYRLHLKGTRVLGYSTRQVSNV
jgi:glycosyltransferase involved in cell wall biosynthesis